MYNITLTHDRAMGNAYAVYTPSIGKSIVLCDGGVMQLTRALREKHIAYTDIQHISNMQADQMQRESIHTYIIEEA